MNEEDDEAERRSLPTKQIKISIQFLNILLSILRIWIRNDAVMNEEDDEAKKRSLPMKQIKISIQLSFHDIVLLCICLYSVNVLCINDSILLICM